MRTESSVLSLGNASVDGSNHNPIAAFNTLLVGQNPSQKRAGTVSREQAGKGQLCQGMVEGTQTLIPSLRASISAVKGQSP